MCEPTQADARSRIREAALDQFGREGVNRVTVRAIAADAGVSPALVVHHFGSKEGLRAECDAHVLSMVRRDVEAGDGREALADAAAGNPSGLAGMLEAATPARRYLARAFLDGTPAAAAFFDEIVELTDAWLAEGVEAGWVRPTTQPRARAALYVTWLLGPLTFDHHLQRVLDIEDVHDYEAAVDVLPVALEMFTHGLFADERALKAWDALRKDRTRISSQEVVR